jgi:hypothetical protein
LYATVILGTPPLWLGHSSAVRSVIVGRKLSSTGAIQSITLHFSTSRGQRRAMMVHIDYSLFWN